ncbi:hypothetical protein DYBT9623_03643 [Dyadobacter sp. CECT 9623]|jgi:predicted RNase H-like HicB family nuclease|uniref:XRE family transcriptional regulator n=1 Tax=Dyadobacter linearis TaxID=2823330 RepID=A0ABN7RA84_9BACT|nr:hypothetical protein [Dyadobacter sp. CECT 9623]CAG5071653.1 hypothetical protein DYBT9623_03643 [Dyadobacter sp. CECT 9623]
MKKPVLTFDIIKEEIGYSAISSSKGRYIATQGDDFEDLKKNIVEAANLASEDFGFEYSIDELILRPDLQSFFEFYKVLNVNALSKRINMNQSLLAQYISGTKKPSSTQTRRILEGVQQVGRELSAIQFLL